ncbi:MAG TPA: AAA family ATPase [Gemmataceae bacterium]|nr:AAA family ATPase [Gemmataceae bacterium]
MDLNHFGLKQRPFQNGLDSAWYYPATTHEQALARLRQAIQEEEGLVLVTGEPGTGKTMLLQCLLERMGPETTSAFLTNSHFADRSSFYQAILFDLSLCYERHSEQEMRLALTDFVLTQYRNGQRLLLLVDEAQNLDLDLLEEIRLLSNLEAGVHKAIQVVLAGQPGLLEMLARPELASLSQRLAVRIPLEPLGLEETADYIFHHLRRAGGRPESIFSDEGLEVVARGSRGIPRLINQITHQALFLAFETGCNTVDAEAALEALALLGLEGETREPHDLGAGRADDEDGIIRVPTGRKPA